MGVPKQTSLWRRLKDVYHVMLEPTPTVPPDNLTALRVFCCLEFIASFFSDYTVLRVVGSILLILSLFSGIHLERPRVFCKVLLQGLISVGIVGAPLAISFFREECESHVLERQLSFWLIGFLLSPAFSFLFSFIIWCCTAVTLFIGFMLEDCADAQDKFFALVLTLVAVLLGRVFWEYERRTLYQTVALHRSDLAQSPSELRHLKKELDFRTGVQSMRIFPGRSRDVTIRVAARDNDSDSDEDSEDDRKRGAPEWLLSAKAIKDPKFVGRGRFGITFQAVHKGGNVRMKKHFAVQLPLETVYREINFLSRIRHPNILLFIGALVHEPDVFTVHEALDRGSLFEVLHDPYLDLPWSLKLSMMVDMATAVALLHSLHPSFIVEELKSRNLFVDESFRVKLGDFGLKQCKRNMDLQHPVSFLGAPHWQAPELFVNERVSEASDVYAVGVVIWEILHRRSPEEMMTSESVPFQVAQGTRLPLEDGNPPGLNVLVSAAWHQDPDRRPSMRRVLHQLRQVLDAYNESSHNVYEKLFQSHAVSSRQSVPLRYYIPLEDITYIEPVGSGSFGEVHKGTFRGTTVAVKKFIADTSSMHKLFIREVETICDLRHPNIVLFMGACIQEEYFALVTAFCERGSLFDILHNPKYKPSPPSNMSSAEPSPSQDLSLLKMLSILVDVAKGMNYLHSSSPPMIHHDLKCGNVLIDWHWAALVADFGLTKLRTRIKSMMVGGTFEYTAPEVLKGQVLTEKVDVYSFAIIIWEIISRQRPYREERQLSGIKDRAAFCKDWLWNRVVEGKTRCKFQPVVKVSHEPIYTRNKVIRIPPTPWPEGAIPPDFGPPMLFKLPVKDDERARPSSFGNANHTVTTEEDELLFPAVPRMARSSAEVPTESLKFNKMLLRSPGPYVMNLPDTPEEGADRPRLLSYGESQLLVGDRVAVPDDVLQHWIRRALIRIVQRCWESEPVNRPTFSRILPLLEGLRGSVRTASLLEIQLMASPEEWCDSELSKVEHLHTPFSIRPMEPVLTALSSVLSCFLTHCKDEATRRSGAKTKQNQADRAPFSPVFVDEQDSKNNWISCTVKNIYYILKEAVCLLQVQPPALVLCCLYSQRTFSCAPKDLPLFRGNGWKKLLLTCLLLGTEALSNRRLAPMVLRNLWRQVVNAKCDDCVTDAHNARVNVLLRLKFGLKVKPGTYAKFVRELRCSIPAQQEFVLEKFNLNQATALKSQTLAYEKKMRKEFGGASVVVEENSSTGTLVNETGVCELTEIDEVFESGSEADGAEVEKKEEEEKEQKVDPEEASLSENHSAASPGEPSPA